MQRHKLELTYCHGSENYFILVDFYTSKQSFKDVDFHNFTVDIVSQLSHLKIDGVLFLLETEHADAQMRIFNRDGSEAEMCGNGFRCIGKKFYQITGKTSYRIKTLSGLIHGQKLAEIFPGIDTYSVLFSRVKFDYEGKTFFNSIIPELSNNIKFTTIDIGNPHLIAQVTEFDTPKLVEMGQKVNRKCKLFPNGNNVSFYKITGDNEIFVMTYERGVGLTASCGTAMAATSALTTGNKQVITGKNISVYSPGGMVQCLTGKNNRNFSVKLSGNATFLDKYNLIYDSHIRKIVDFQQIVKFNKEIDNYQAFKSHITINKKKYAE